MPKNRKNGVMKKTLFDICVKEIKKNHIKNVKLYSTGEPLLHPEFDYIIRRLHDEGLTITVSTNGSQLNKHRETLMMVNHLQISIDGWDQQSYDFLHPPHKFQDILAGVKEFSSYALAQETRPQITLHLLLTKKTDVDAYKRLWGCYADDITMSHLMGTSYYTGCRFVTEQPAVLKEYLYPFDVDTSRGCEYPFDILSIAYDGKIVLCCQDFNAEIPLGDIDDGLQKVFTSGALKNIRKGFLHGVPSVCKDCSRFYKVRL